MPFGQKKPPVNSSKPSSDLTPEASPVVAGAVTGRAKTLLHSKVNPLLGSVWDDSEIRYPVALVCEHWAPAGVCRHNCPAWKAATAVATEQSA